MDKVKHVDGHRPNLQNWNTEDQRFKKGPLSCVRTESEVQKETLLSKNCAGGSKRDPILPK